VHELETLSQAIGEREARLRDAVPANRQAALLALLRAQDRLPPATDRGADEAPDLITGRHVPNLGGKKAVQLCLEASGRDLGEQLDDEGLARWADAFLRSCADLAAAELVLGHCELGFMRMVASGGTHHAWIATRRTATIWQERQDIDWWAAALARQHLPAAQGDPRRLAESHLAAMAWQLSYPPEAVLGGHPVERYRQVLGWLIARVLQQKVTGQEAAWHEERALIATLAADLAMPTATAADLVSAFTVDAENAAYHAAVPGVATPPLVRVADQIAMSRVGLLTEPFIVLSRELRRRDPQDYHNSAHQREDVFRQDLYTQFRDKRFVTSAGRVELRRAQGDVRTDIDAAIFDRKTGTLALFELKSQDPFARTSAELDRQRDNVLYANRQVAGTLDWIKRHGADEVLKRIDPRAARSFRVQKVLPFVLGRYLVHFNGGAEPDRRAAWGTWPRVLRLMAEGSRAAPLVSLHARLAKDERRVEFPESMGAKEIVLGEVRLVVHPSYAAFRGTTP